MGGVTMTDAERLKKLKQFVYDELELSLEQVERATELKDWDRKDRWQRRYDTLYGVWLRIID